MSKLSIAWLIAAGALIVIGLSSVFGAPDDMGGVYIAVGVALAAVIGFREMHTRSPRLRKTAPTLLRVGLRVAVIMATLWTAYLAYVYVVALLSAQGGGGELIIPMAIPWIVIAGGWWLLDRVEDRAIRRKLDGESNS